MGGCGVRGEITVVVGGFVGGAAAGLAPADLAGLVGDAEATGMSRKEAIAAVAAEPAPRGAKSSTRWWLTSRSGLTTRVRHASLTR